MKVYISGMISGIPIERARHHFRAAEEYLKNEGFVVLSPTILPKGLEYSEYLIIDLKMIEVADAIYMLHGWDESDGAQLELKYAEMMGKIILYE